MNSEFIKSLFEEKDLSTIPAIAHGQRFEDAARTDYLESKRMAGHGNLQVRRCGLLLHPSYKYIGASPDGQVYDPSSSGHSHGLLEIKCPHTPYLQDLTPEEACDLTGFCAKLVNGRPELQENHAYYFQIQGQLGISGLKWCDFVIWTGPRRLSVERIHSNEDFWAEVLLPALLQFYAKHIKESM